MFQTDIGSLTFFFLLFNQADFIMGMLMVSQMLETLAWQAFWMQTGSDNIPIPANVNQLRQRLMTKSVCRPKFGSVLIECSDLYEIFHAFLLECESKSELCQYFGVFQMLVQLCKQIVAAEDDSNWHLHVGRRDAAVHIFQEFGALNYLRYGSYYLENIKMLEAEHPSLYNQFLRGLFVVKDRDNASFAAVAPDMKLEQTINRFSQGSGGHVIVGSSGNAINLLFHAGHQCWPQNNNPTRVGRSQRSNI